MYFLAAVSFLVRVLLVAQTALPEYPKPGEATVPSGCPSVATAMPLAPSCGIGTTLPNKNEEFLSVKKNTTGLDYGLMYRNTQIMGILSESYVLFTSL